MTNTFPYITPAQLPALHELADSIGESAYDVAVAYNDWCGCADNDAPLEVRDFGIDLLSKEIRILRMTPPPALFVLAEETTPEALRLGDLFSAYGPEYWSHVPHANPAAIGERVFIRSSGPVAPDELGSTTYRLTILTDPLDVAVHQAFARRAAPGSGFAGLAQDVLSEVA